MVSEKLIETWKRKAEAGEAWAIEKLKSLEPHQKPKRKRVIRNPRQLKHDRRLNFKLPDKLYFDFELYREKLGYNIKTGRSDCLRKLLEEILESKIKMLGLEPLSFGNPLGCGIIPED